MHVMLATVVITVGAASCAYAQAGSLVERDSLAARLNQALELLSPTNLSENIDVNDLGIEVLGLHGCEQIWNENTSSEFYPNGLKLKRHDDETISMEIANRPASSMQLTYNSHLVPCYLNGMMFHNWGKPFFDSLSDYVFWDVPPPDGAPHPPSTETPLSTQKYYMGSHDITLHMEDSVLPTLQDKSYSSTALEDYSGTIHGEDLFNVNRPEMSFIAQFKPAPVGGLDTHYAKPTEWELRFVDENGDPTWDLALDTTVASIKFIARTQRYSPDDCSFGSFLPVDDSAWCGIIVTLAWKDGLGAFHEDPYSPMCYHSFKDPGGPDINNAALWSNYNFLAGGPLNWWCRFDLDPDGWLVFEIFGGNCALRDTFKIRRIKNPDIPAQICETYFPSGGEFCVDHMTGEIDYWTGGCNTGERQAVTCLAFCRPVTGSRAMSGVIAASVQTFSDEWPYSYSDYGNPVNHSSTHQSGETGKWRPKGYYSYRTSILPADPEFGLNSRVYTNAGVFTNDIGSTSNAFRLYDFMNESANDPVKWLKGDTITKFSPSGEPVEEQDVLGVYSAARFGHSQMLPKLVAKNAQYETVDFESFEDGAGNTTTAAHSGRYAYLFESGTGVQLLGPFTITEQVRDQGIQIQFWAKKTYWNAASHPSPPISVTVDGLSTSATLDSVAKTGAWTLYRMNIDDISGTAQVDETFTIFFQKEIGSGDSLWIDDIRVQPMDAEMICYVYDPFWLRLAATFDDQHFGQFYQYNGEGKLIRTIKETERGMKTVAETHYHTPLIDRDAPLSAPMIGYGGMNAVGPASPFAGTKANSDRGDGMNANADIFDFELSEDGTRTKIFGKDPSQLPTLEDLGEASRRLAAVDLSWLGGTNMPSTDRIERLNLPDVPDIEKIRVLQEVRELDRKMEELTRLREKAATDAEREAIEEEARQLHQRKITMLREKLGLTEEKLRELKIQAEDGQ